MENNIAHKHAEIIFNAATPVINIFRVGGKRWKRNVAKGPRIGPWLQGEYRIINEMAWRHKGACLYFVKASDAGIGYVGISRNRLKDRWRTSPAYDAETMSKLPKNQLFHSQCWKQIEVESLVSPGITYEVRAITAAALIPILEQIGARFLDSSFYVETVSSPVLNDGYVITAAICLCVGTKL
jgi:hypothetical protein